MKKYTIVVLPIAVTGGKRPFSDTLNMPSRVGISARALLVVRRFCCSGGGVFILSTTNKYVLKITAHSHNLD